MKLYRGDNIFNDKTEPFLYRNNGLLSKAFGSECNPANIELQGLLESIRKHVKPENISDKNYYDITDFLSFSESRERALFWCSDMERLILQNVDNYQETRYLFVMYFDNCNVKSLGNGIYTFNFYCNPSLKTSDSGKETHLTFLKHLHREEICPICRNQIKNHRILLINSFEYLKENAHHSKYNGAIEFAEKDKEWLILPFDPLRIHRSVRIPRADFWVAEHFKGIGEKRPSLNCI